MGLFEPPVSVLYVMERPLVVERHALCASVGGIVIKRILAPTDLSELSLAGVRYALTAG